MSIILLLIGAFGIRMFMASLDPFLHLWDEKFHALVAKNMLDNPFEPLLYTDPVMPYDFKSWVSNHIWLHKQPFFLWQIALFFKLFGVNEFVLRMPSVLMSTVQVFFIYRIGKISLNNRTGYYAAFLLCLSNYIIEMVSGSIIMDHNDVAIIFYTTASIWAWTEYTRSKRKYWLVLIGLFSGFAILSKWLIGLLVYSGWGLSIILNREMRLKRSYYYDLLKSLLITIIIVLPWQIYILVKFPIESAYEYTYNARHIYEVVENHAGNMWYHFNQIGPIYGPIVPFILVFALIFLFYELKNYSIRVAFITYAVLPYFFFSVIVSTKMPNYCMVACPIIFLSLGKLIDKLNFIFERVKNVNIYQLLLFTFLCVIGYTNFNIEKIQWIHTNQNKKSKNRVRQVAASSFFKELPLILPSDEYVIFNAGGIFRNIDVMFYTNNIAYRGLFKYEEYLDLKKRGFKIAVLDDGRLPEFILDDDELLKINYPKTK
ncbi:MAG: glycosyltransferase family 39 protein [Bacteroidia bacterium]|nr:glycosyltransferase family 39 protein [Bacteroidia bacterium]